MTVKLPFRFATKFVTTLLLILTTFLLLFTISKNEIEDSEANAQETWLEGSDLNVSTYVQVEPNFWQLPSNKTVCKLLILVASAPSNFQARSVIRKTWSNDKWTLKHETCTIFVIGHKLGRPEDMLLVQAESQQFQDILGINVHDSYHNLTLKSVFMLKFVSSEIKFRQWKFLLKTDDDSYVNIPALAKLARQQKKWSNYFVGVPLGKNVSRSEKWSVPNWMYKYEHFPPSVSGCGYLFPAKFATCLYAKSLSTPIITLEDVYVTGLLAKKCHMNHIRSLHFKHMGIEDLCRIDPFKDVIIHKVDISKMHQRITGQNVHESNTELLKPLCND